MNKLLAMKNGLSGRKANGFTLIELTIVIVILGILAVILMTMVGSALMQSKESATASALGDLRKQISTYRAQHGDTVPDGSVLVTLLTKQTDLYGNVGTGSQYTYGPYYFTFPANPFNGRNDVKAIATGSPLLADDTTGWLYRIDATGFTIEANTSILDSNGRAVVTY